MPKLFEGTANPTPVLSRRIAIGYAGINGSEYITLAEAKTLFLTGLLHNSLDGKDSALTGGVTYGHLTNAQYAAMLVHNNLSGKDSATTGGVTYGHITNAQYIALSKNILSTSSSASITPTGNYKENEYYITALGVVTMTINNPSGTAVNGNTLLIRVKDNGSQRAIAWGTAYTSIGATLPIETTSSKVMYIGLIYNSTTVKWECVSVITQI